MILKALHILQANPELVDLEVLEGLARSGKIISGWTVPAAAMVGDDALIYAGGLGFIATASITSVKQVSSPGRSQARLKIDKSLQPPIALKMIRDSVPSLKWARKPSSVTTVSTATANALRGLISSGRCPLCGYEFKNRSDSEVHLDGRCPKDNHPRKSGSIVLIQGGLPGLGKKR